MRTITKQIELYKFDELETDAARTKAREWWLSGNDLDLSAERDHAIAMLKLIGFLDPAIDVQDLGEPGGVVRISGSWRYRPEWRRLLDHHFETVTDPGQEFIGPGMPDALPGHMVPWYLAGARFGMAVNFLHDNPIDNCDHRSLAFDVRVINGHPEKTIMIGDDLATVHMYGVESRIAQGITTLQRAIYNSILAEKDYQESDDQIDETLIANDYEFTADGDRYVD